MVGLLHDASAAAGGSGHLDEFDAEGLHHGTHGVFDLTSRTLGHAARKYAYLNAGMVSPQKRRSNASKIALTLVVVVDVGVHNLGHLSGREETLQVTCQRATRTGEAGRHTNGGREVHQGAKWPHRLRGKMVSLRFPDHLTVLENHLT